MAQLCDRDLTSSCSIQLQLYKVSNQLEALPLDIFDL